MTIAVEGCCALAGTVAAAPVAVVPVAVVPVAAPRLPLIAEGCCRLRENG